MKRICTFLYITLILFSVFACTMPSELEIIGSPLIKFAAYMSLGDYFSDMTDNMTQTNNSSDVLPCTNPSLDYMAFVLHMEVFNKENGSCDFDLPSFVHGSGSIFINVGGTDVEIPVDYIDDGSDSRFFVLENDKTIAESDDDNPFILSFMDIEQYLDGFAFKGIQAKIYISGSPLVNVLSIDLHEITANGPHKIVDDDGSFEKGPSGLKSLEEYTGTSLPAKGKEIDISDIINSSGNLHLGYKIYINEGQNINLDWLEDINIVAEIVIWLPMDFETIKNDAIIKFPDHFNEFGDFFKSLAGIEFIEDINMHIAFAPLNPFSKGFFIINDAGYGDIKCSLDNYNINLIFTEKELEYINNNPFNPTFYILYPTLHSELRIPNGDLSISTISLNARLKYNMDLK